MQHPGPGQPLWQSSYGSVYVTRLTGVAAILVAVSIVGVSIVAVLVPARRATAVDPIIALRAP